MHIKRPPCKYLIVFSAIVIVFVLIGYFWHSSICTEISRYYHLFSDRARIQDFITSFGFFAPFVFVLLQILQVVLVPIPGEASGIIGGFLFGAANGFLYSTIGLTFGSWINFMIGRFMGKRFVRKMIRDDYITRFDGILKRQGIVLIFILFLSPGFPKDYLCLFLGLSTIPIKLFMMFAAVGRMPGTFMLSLQGAALFEKNYQLLAVMVVISLILIFLVYHYRDKIYEKIAVYNGKTGQNDENGPK